MIQGTLREKAQSVNVAYCMLLTHNLQSFFHCTAQSLCVCVLTVANLKLRPEILLFDCSVRTAACGFHQHRKRLPLALLPGRSCGCGQRVNELKEMLHLDHLGRVAAR